jgi:hypothetical protein
VPPDYRPKQQNARVRSRLAAQGMFLACGAWMAGLGLYFIFMRPPLLPEDLRYFGMTLEEVEATAPQLLRWLQHVFAVMGGYMLATGILTAFIATRLLPTRLTTAVLALAGVFSVVLMSAVNFAIDSDYKWLMLVPALLWITGIAAVLFAGWLTASRCSVN